MPPRRRRNKVEPRAPLVFTESPVHITHGLPSPVYASEHPAYADVIPLDSSTTIPWVSPQFAAVPSSGVRTRRMRRQTSQSTNTQPASRRGTSPSRTRAQITGRYIALQMLGDPRNISEESDSSAGQISVSDIDGTESDCDNDNNNNHRPATSDRPATSVTTEPAGASTVRVDTPSNVDSDHNYTPIRPLYKGGTTGRKKRKHDLRKSLVKPRSRAQRVGNGATHEGESERTGFDHEVSFDFANGTCVETGSHEHMPSNSRHGSSISPEFTQIRPRGQEGDPKAPTRRLFTDRPHSGRSRTSYENGSPSLPSDKGDNTSVTNISYDISTPTQNDLNVMENHSIRKRFPHQRRSARLKAHKTFFSDLLNSTLVTTDDHIFPTVLVYDTPESEYGKSIRWKQLHGKD